MSVIKFKYKLCEVVTGMTWSVSTAAVMATITLMLSSSGCFEVAPADRVPDNHTKSEAVAGTMHPPHISLPDSFNLTASTSTVLDATSYLSDTDEIVAYSWNTGDGRVINKSVIKLYYPNPGTYNLTLTVTGRSGYILTASSLVEVHAADEVAKTPNFINPASTPIITPTPVPTVAIDPVITHIEFDPPGRDGDKLNEEWVEIFNRGESVIDMGGWKLADLANHSYIFHEGFKLEAGGKVRVHVGEGTDSATDLYMNSTRPIWNNDGDTATLYDDSGVILDQYSYMVEITSTPTATPTPAPTQAHLAGVLIYEINFNPEGDDRVNLTGEWVEILNNGSEPVNMEGWLLKDAKNHTYVFPDGFTLFQGAKVRVHVGEGTDSATDLYMNSTCPIWNNDGDTATLFDEVGEIVDQYSY